MKLYQIVFVLSIIWVDVLWASSFPVRLLSERHRTEKNWVEYRLSLTNLSNSSLVNPTIRYFAENPRIQYCKANPNDAKCEGSQYNVFDVDSTLKAIVDYHSVVHSVDTSFYYGSDYTVISLKFKGTIPAQATSVVHLRIMKKKYPDWDCSNDYSYQANAATQKNYKMAVYDGNGNILWGNDPVAIKHDTVNAYWYDRAGMTVVSRYDGSDSAKVLDGRFWMLKVKPLSFEERESLDSMGVKLLETTRYQNNGLHLLKALVPISKKLLNKILSGFYNAFMVDDSTHLSLNLSSEDLYDETYSCDANDSCLSIVSERSAINLVVGCWPDLPIGSCKNIVLDCGANSAYVDRDVVLTKVRRNSVRCLEKHRDVRFVLAQREGKLLNYGGRRSINLMELQNDANWQQAMQASLVTTDWLKNVDYTGEGVSVGVYDTGIDFRHPGFNEFDSLGNEIPRKAVGYDDWRIVGDVDSARRITDNHGTHVAGIIGGNGRLSETVVNATPYQFRGVAPKVLFHSGYSFVYNQKGNVVNHSHEWAETEKIDDKHAWSYYGIKNADLDRNIFSDWKHPSEQGDYLTKTVVFGAGNEANKIGPTGHGYHSMRIHSKNAIVVGAFNSSNNSRENFSSMGPTWDGRIKPDIMAPGNGLSLTPDKPGIVSSVPYGLSNKYYERKYGTSMAAPFVSGIVALMYQKFQKITSTPLDAFSMRNSTTKALLIHSAIDMKDGEVGPNCEISITDHMPGCFSNNPYTLGPDYSTGWGRVDAKGALDLMDGYDVNAMKFDKFREFDIYDGTQMRWTINVDEPKPRLRVTLAWDDAPGDPNINNYMQSKLVNDLDLYLISPSGKIYYPWQLDTLSTKNMNDKGEDVGDERITARKWGYERISVADASKPAYTCSTSINSYLPLDTCFDRRNNVEVVDVENPPLGVWQVVVKGYRVEVGNSSDGGAQIASIVSDLKLHEPMNSGPSPYASNVQTSEIIPLGDYLEHYVTFGPETSLGIGDHIYLYDGWGHLIGDYMGNSLANQRILVKTKFLKIILDSDNDQSQGYGYSISKIEHVPYGVLQVLFPPYKKGD
jgi:subtilisin family serine protease